MDEQEAIGSDMVPAVRTVRLIKDDRWVMYPVETLADTLLSDIILLSDTALDGIGCPTLHDAVKSFTGAMANALDTVNRAAAYYRREQIQHELDLALELLNEIQQNRKCDYIGTYVVSYVRDRTEKYFAISAKRLRKAARPVSRAKATAYKLIEESGLGVAPALTIDFRSLDKRLSQALRYEIAQDTSADPQREVGEKVQQEIKNNSNTADIDLLNAFSNELGDAYTSVLDMVAEVENLDSLAAEDEYFIEQVRADYLPAIIGPMKRFASSDLDDKESAANEALKQLRVIQCGLDDIAKRATQSVMSQMRAQTDFLTQKVIGDAALTLSPSELTEQVAAQAEEAVRFRESLYAKHVAPVLAANKADYDNRLRTELQKAKDEFQQEKDYLMGTIMLLEDDKKSLELKLHNVDRKLGRLADDLEYKIKHANRRTQPIYYEDDNFLPEWV